MIGLPSIANPWVILGVVAALAGAYTGGRVQGGTAGENRVQARWDAEAKQRAFDTIKAKERNDEENERLQAGVDARRAADARAIADLTARSAALALELQQRPARADNPGVAAAGSGFGSQSWGTGTGLFRDDAMFLAGKAELWQRIRLQRDTCYRQYEDLAAALERLRTAGTSSQ